MIFVCVCEFSDGREGKTRRGGHLKREGYGVLRGWGTDPQVHSYSESRGLDLSQESALKMDNPA